MSEMHWPEITKGTPLTEVKRIHQAIWDYAIEHGEKPKTPYISDCAGCEYTSGLCSYCPICWPENSYFEKICILGGLFTQWRETSGQEKVDLVCKIRDLPFKYELEEKKNV